MSELVSLKSLASEIGIDKSNLRRYALSIGIKPGKSRTKDSGGQLALVFTQEQAQKIIEARRENGFSVNDDNKRVIVDDSIGSFYIVHLLPNLGVNRVKLGFTSNIKQRIGAHKTVCPNAKVVKTWPCKKVWEQAAIDSLTRVECEHIGNEVYECDSIDNLVSRGEDFFSIMPDMSGS